MSGQTRSASSQFSSWFFAPSPPMNVFTSGTSIFSAASMTCLRWPMTVGAVLGVRVERVRVEAEAGDRQALGLDLVDGSRVAWPSDRFATSMWLVPA